MLFDFFILQKKITTHTQIYYIGNNTKFIISQTVTTQPSTILYISFIQLNITNDDRSVSPAKRKLSNYSEQIIIQTAQSVLDMG